MQAPAQVTISQFSGCPVNNHLTPPSSYIPKLLPYDDVPDANISSSNSHNPKPNTENKKPALQKAKKTRAKTRVAYHNKILAAKIESEKEQV